MRGAWRGEYEGTRAYEGDARSCYGEACWVEDDEVEVTVGNAEIGQGIGCGIPDDG